MFFLILFYKKKTANMKANKMQKGEAYNVRCDTKRDKIASVLLLLCQGKCSEMKVGVSHKQLFLTTGKIVLLYGI